MDAIKGLRNGCVLVSMFVMMLLCWLTTLLFILPALSMLHKV